MEISFLEDDGAGASNEEEDDSSSNSSGLVHGLVLEQVSFSKVSCSASRARRPWRHCQTLLHGLVFCQTLLHGLVLEQDPFAKVYGSASRGLQALEALPHTFAWSSFLFQPFSAFFRPFSAFFSLFKAFFSLEALPDTCMPFYGLVFGQRHTQGPKGPLKRSN